jgi:hypothetical protein
MCRLSGTDRGLRKSDHLDDFARQDSSTCDTIDIDMILFGFGKILDSHRAISPTGFETPLMDPFHCAIGKALTNTFSRFSQDCCTVEVSRSLLSNTIPLWPVHLTLTSNPTEAEFPGPIPLGPRVK